MEKFDERGREIPDTTPIEIPANARRPESMQETIMRMVNQQVSQVAQQNDMPTFEEEDDFDDPTDNLTEVGGDYYITQAEVEPIGPENDLDGSQGPLVNTDSGRGSTGDDPTSGLSEAPAPKNEAEAPQEE